MLLRTREAWESLEAVAEKKKKEKKAAKENFRLCDKQEQIGNWLSLYFATTDSKNAINTLQGSFRNQPQDFVDIKTQDFNSTIRFSLFFFCYFSKS